jgi:hypothetical protein
MQHVGSVAVLHASRLRGVLRQGADPDAHFGCAAAPRTAASLPVSKLREHLRARDDGSGLINHSQRLARFRPMNETTAICVRTCIESKPCFRIGAMTGGPSLWFIVGEALGNHLGECMTYLGHVRTTPLSDGVRLVRLAFALGVMGMLQH